MKQTYCALMPMKGHSERVPSKNVRLIAGKPLCCWMLDMLAAVAKITRIVVDTDSEEIADLIGGKPKVEVVVRPEALRGDLVSMNRIIAHDISLMGQYDHFVQTHATNPLLRAETLETAIHRYESHPCDSLFSVTRHQARFYRDDGTPVNHNPDMLIRTQDLSPLYEENSNFYLFGRESFSSTNARIGRHPLFCEVPPLEAVDIDDYDDWVLAELLLENSGKWGERVR